jgi:hypothetical protein
MAARKVDSARAERGFSLLVNWQKCVELICVAVVQDVCKASAE